MKKIKFLLLPTFLFCSFGALCQQAETALRPPPPPPEQPAPPPPPPISPSHITPVHLIKHYHSKPLQLIKPETRRETKAPAPVVDTFKER